MTNPPSGISLSELIRLAFPDGAQVEGAPTVPGRQVGWVCRAALPLAANAFEADDLVLIAEVESETAWPGGLEALSRGGAAAVATGLPIPSDAVRHAGRLGLPLIVYPREVSPREVERRVLALLLDRQTHLSALGAQIQARLAKLSVENAGLGAMVRAMAEITGKSVLLQNKRLEVMADFAQAGLAEFWPEIASQLSESAELPSDLRDRRQAAGVPRPERQPMPGGLARLVCPIVVKDMARGYLSIVGLASELDALDELVAIHGAAACAVEMAKAKAVSEAEKRLRGDFADAALTGTLPASEGARWANRIGYDPEPPHAAVVWTWEGEAHPSLRRLETVAAAELARSGLTALIRLRESEVVAFAAEDDLASARNASLLARSVVQAAKREFPDARLACGIGRPAGDLSRWKESYKEASQALGMARRLAEPGPMYYGDLSVYRLLFLLEGHPELETFCRNVLGPILEYEGAADLLDTLRAYFEHHGNLTQTAESLFIHRNTLLYRMERITQIGGINLNDPETRLAVQLALKARRLLQGREDSRK